MNGNFVNLVIFLFSLAIGGLEAYVGYEVLLVPGSYYKVLTDKDKEGFQNVCLKSSALILGISLIKAIKKFTARRLLVRWRRALCSHVQSIYLQGINFYKLSILEENIDNPDQRITADVNSLVTTYGKLVEDDLFIIPIKTGYYAYKAYEGAGWIAPTAMFGLFILSFINKIFMTQVADRTANVERKEGDFRIKHMGIMERSEALAFQGSVAEELRKTDSLLDEVCTSQEQLYNWTFPLDLSTSLFSYIGSIASYVVISIPIFSGYYNLEGGDLAQMISNNVSFCMNLIWQFTQMVNMASLVANMAGSTHRVSEIIESLSKYSDIPIIVSDEMKHNDESKQLLQMHDLDIIKPKSETPLIRTLTLEVNESSNLLILGPSGSGKTSILRVIRSLWPMIHGTLNCIKETDIFFFPQQQYFSEGSLREQITETKSENKNKAKDTEEILELLEITQLTGLLSRCGSLDRSPQWNWLTVLSPGEIQRLMWTRLLFRKPRIAFLDEATSAISESLQETLYAKLAENGITVVSVGHRESLIPFHNNILILDGAGGWKLSPTRIA